MPWLPYVTPLGSSTPTVCGSAAAKTSSTTIAATLSSAAANVGDFLVAVGGWIGPAGGSPATTPFSDSKGNTWFFGLSPVGTGPGNAFGFLVVATALTTADTVTMTSLSASSGRTLLVLKFAPGPTFTDPINVSSTGQNTSGTTTPSSGALGAPAYSIATTIGSVVANGPTGDTFTEDTDNTGGDTWHSSTVVGTSGGQASANITQHTAVKITTSSASQTYNPTLGTSRPWACLVTQFVVGINYQGQTFLQAVARSAL